MELTLTGIFLHLGAAVLIIVCLIFAGIALTLDWIKKDEPERKRQNGTDAGKREHRG